MKNLNYEVFRKAFYDEIDFQKEEDFETFLNLPLHERIDRNDPMSYSAMAFFFFGGKYPLDICALVSLIFCLMQELEIDGEEVLAAILKESIIEEWIEKKFDVLWSRIEKIDFDGKKMQKIEKNDTLIIYFE